MSLGQRSSALAAVPLASLFRASATEVAVILLLLFTGVILLLVWLWARENRRAHQLLYRKNALGKQIAEFWQDLATSPPERVEAGVQKGLERIIEVADAERICWYELDEGSSELVRLFTAAKSENAPLSPAVVAASQMPFASAALARSEPVVLRGLEDLPAEAETDRKLLGRIGVKSLVLLPSSYGGKKKGVLGLTSYSEKGTWTGDFIYQLGCIANIIGAILERQLVHEASQEGEERFRYLFEQASIGIALETVEGRILHVNPAFCSMIGYEERELLDLSCGRISHPDDEEIEKVLFEELRQGTRSSYRIEKRFFRKGGSIMWGQVSVSMLQQNHGKAPLVIGMVSDVTAQKNVEESLHRRDQELQYLAGQLITAQEAERSRISRELHDDIGHRVALLACELEQFRRNATSPSRKTGSLEELQKHIDQLGTDIHNLSHELHSSSLKHCGLGVALRDLCENYSHTHQIKVELSAGSLDSTLSDDMSLCLFRVAQEALANALKHSQTRRILVSASQESANVRLSVKDFGIGFDPAIQSSGIGLTSMRERLRIFGGELRVTSQPNLGAEIIAELPLPVKPATMTAQCGSAAD
jgi:PAS domain S-box-containing protein